jgi:hypothetical protein
MWGCDNPPHSNHQNLSEEFARDRTEFSSRQVGTTHQVKVALTRCTPPFVKSPDDKALTPTAVTRREDSRDTGGVFTIVGFYIAAWVAFKAEGIEQGLLRAEEAHCQ